MKKFLKWFKAAIMLLFHITKECIITLKLSHPCKKCIIKMCCTQRCWEKAEYDEYSQYNGMKFNKIFAAFILVVMLCFIYHLVAMLYFIYHIAYMIIS
ncbi:MAG: hypothetical protein ACFFG0_24455 [Candidatus Thorarchaeota archaeon]